MFPALDMQLENDNFFMATSAVHVHAAGTKITKLSTQLLHTT